MAAAVRRAPGGGGVEHDDADGRWAARPGVPGGTALGVARVARHERVGGDEVGARHRLRVGRVDRGIHRRAVGAAEGGRRGQRAAVVVGERGAAELVGSQQGGKARDDQYHDGRSRERGRCRADDHGVHSRKLAWTWS